MATSTLQSPAASPSPSSTPSSVKNPQLKRVVYSKYRELLGSYNDKANAIIDTLPAYMVRQDRGFQLSELPLNADGKNCLESSYGQRGGGGGGGSGGGGYEAPACVQNAMMTKDKKPFTYTPGGIDLSQIRSERMAKRLARNAQSEGATGAAQQNRPAQPQSPGGATSAANAMGAAAMGMPFQVLPPPPPPQPQTQGPKSFDNSNNNNNSNSYSPMQQQQQQQQQKYPTPPETPLQQQQQQLQEQQSPRQEFRSVAMPTSPSVSVYTRQAESPRSPFERQTESPRSPFEQQRPPAASSPLAQAPQQQQQQAAQSVPWRTQRAQPAPQQQQQQSAPQHPQPIYNNVQQQQQQQQQLQQQQQQRSRDVFSPGRIETSAATNFNAQPQQQQNFGQQQAQYPGATKPTNVGSLYIAPLAQPTEPQAQRILLQQQQQTRESRDSPMRQLPQQQQPQSLPQQQQPQGNQPLRWLSSQPASKEQAPWARPEENGNVLPSTLRQTTPAPQPQPQVAQQQAPQSQTSFYQPQLVQGNGYGPTPGAVSAAISQQNFGSHPQGGGLRLQINLNTNGSNNNATQSAPRERIIPITLEQTPTYAAAQPNFGAPGGHIIRSANQFVDQGYNNYPAQSSHTQWREPSSQRVLSPNLQPPTGNGISSNGNANANAARIIPISIEGGRGGPVSQSPVLLQNDPRSPPIQSKSFRILQKITDTVDDGSGGDPPRQESPQQPVSLDGAGVPQLQRPQFARQMSAQQARNSPTIEQMRRLQLAQDQQQSGTPLAWSPQGNGVSAQNRFTPQHYDSPQQQTQQYVPPSEQQVPEPKKYTGSAIPSRSFKILQAMTTPENAGPGQSDL